MEVHASSFRVYASGESCLVSCSILGWCSFQCGGYYRFSSSNPSTYRTIILKLTAKIPVDRLLGSDLQRSGAVAALVIIAIVIFVIVVNQIRVIRKTGMLPYYLSRYIAAGVILAVLAALPTLTFRLHHVRICE